MTNYLIQNATIVNRNRKFVGHVLIADDIITKISESEIKELPRDTTIIDATGKLLIPGVIDDQVHFREPGLTHKAEIYSESKAAVAGGVTSFMEMPNTIPQATSLDILEDKYSIAAQSSFGNYSFYMGATNDNINEIKKVDPKKICGIKVFMGSSTGNMLVDNTNTLSKIFAEAPTLVATHCEDEETIRHNTELYKNKFGEDVPISYHPIIRSEEACYKSSSFAAELASKYNTRLHILHLSTAKELELLESKPISEKRITGEVCVHHLWFNSNDYEKYGTKIKWNPAVKTINDREALREGLKNGKLDVVATDHAPHTSEEKNNSYFKAPSGGPLVQHSLTMMLELYHEGVFSLEKIVEKMCHAPAELYRIDKRGYIDEGYFADLVLVDLNSEWTISKDNILYKCKWSPLEGKSLKSKITHTFINGELVFDNGNIKEDFRGRRLNFNI